MGKHCFPNANNSLPGAINQLFGEALFCMGKHGFGMGKHYCPRITLFASGNHSFLLETMNFNKPCFLGGFLHRQHYYSKSYP